MFVNTANDIEHLPSTMFCGNDHSAMGVYDAISELSLRIP